MANDANNDINKKIAKAKQVEAGARNFTKSVEGSPTSMFGPKPKAPETKAPYSLVKKISNMANQEQEDSKQTGEALKSNYQNVDAYEKVYGKP